MTGKKMQEKGKKKNKGNNRKVIYLFRRTYPGRGTKRTKNKQKKEC